VSTVTAARSSAHIWSSAHSTRYSGRSCKRRGRVGDVDSKPTVVRQESVKRNVLEREMQVSLIRCTDLHYEATASAS